MVRYYVDGIDIPIFNKMDIGKKRARKETEPKEEREKKRAKVDEGASDKTVKVSIKKIPKPNATKGQAQSKATSMSIYQVLDVWTLTSTHP